MNYLKTDVDDCFVDKGNEMDCRVGRLLGACVSAPLYHLRKCPKSCREYIEVCIRGKKALGIVFKISFFIILLIFIKV